jgi:Galactosyltransferase
MGHLATRVEPLGPPGSEARAKILIGICSCDRFRDRRSAVRETWLRTLPFGIRVLFFSGDAKATDEPGLVSLPVQDTYEHLAGKVHCFYRYALEHYDFEYLFKCDDDTYVRPERLCALPRSGVDFLGSMEVLRGYAQGGAGYLMSRPMVKHFASQSVVTDRPEDVFFTERAIASGMSLASTARLQGYGDQVPEVDNEVVTGHWLRPFEMKRVHAGFTGKNPAPVFKLRASHDEWSGWVRLYADASFWSQGGAHPNGVWEAANLGESLVLRWNHWPSEALRLQSWGFKGEPLRLEFVNSDNLKQWQRMSAAWGWIPSKMGLR